MENTKLFINGQWVASESGETVDVINPANATVIGKMSCASTDEVDRAVQSAKKALNAGAWKMATGNMRRRWLLKFSAELRKAKHTVAEVTTDEVGMPISFTQGTVKGVCEYLDYYAGWADKIGGETIPVPSPGMLDYTIRHPVGVVAAIVPWNVPVFIAVAKLAPALAAGCTIVLKPSELAPLSVLEFIKCAERAGLPPGVVNVVTGLGDVGAALVQHPDVNMVSFTGGPELGAKVGAEAAKTYKRTALELGGKSANIIFDDANLDAAIPVSVMGFMLNTGQQCTCGSRILVQRGVYEEVIERLVQTASAYPIGDPRVPTNMVGPLISEQHLERVLGFVDIASSAGRVVLGGKRLMGDLEKGYYLSPTLVADADPKHRLCREEVFGPVAAIIPFDTAAEALEMANDSEFGLVSGVWTQNLDRAHGMAAELKAGTVWVNTYLSLHPSTPFGGHGASGVGREGGWAAIEDYTELSNVMIHLGGL